MATQVEQHEPVVVSPRSQRESLARFVRRNGLQLGIIGVFLVILLVLILGAGRTFLSPNIYTALMSTIPFFGIVAMPLTMIVIAREIDLSFGSIMAISMVGYVLVYNGTQSVFLGFIAALVVGFVAGLLNGVIIVRLGVPSLITTIGTMFLWRGAVLIIVNGQGASLTNVKDTLLHGLLVGRIAKFIPVQFLWMIGIAIVVWVFQNRHRFGAHIYLIGDNDNSARLMGVNVDRTRMLIFAFVGLAAALAGVMQSMEVNSFFPATLGDGYLMPTLAAVFLGGTSVFGGTGTILGTFVGCLIIAIINPGMIAIGLTGYWTQFVYGFIIVVSVAMHTIMRRRAV
ncbi:MAG: ABC transporter permease [Chloroflexota bacterium]